MDMNDILNQWDKMQADEKKKAREATKKPVQTQPQVSHKKANAGEVPKKPVEQKTEQPVKKQPEINPMEMWLRRYGTVDKDKIAEETAEREKFTDRNYLLNMKPEAFIDLHGLHQDEARERLENFVTDCKRKGLKKILIIHGKGIHTSGTDPVLGELVRRFIEQDKRCGASGHPKTKQEGGTGATWVLLK